MGILLVFTAAGAGIDGDATVLANDVVFEGVSATSTRSTFARGGAELGGESDLAGDALVLAEDSVVVTSPMFALAGAGIKVRRR
jgi:hypothetical protein